MSKIKSNKTDVDEITLKTISLAMADVVNKVKNDKDSKTYSYVSMCDCISSLADSYIKIKNNK